jgi:hypothetical protein
LQLWHSSRTGQNHLPAQINLQVFFLGDGPRRPRRPREQAAALRLCVKYQRNQHRAGCILDAIRAVVAAAWARLRGCTAVYGASGAPGERGGAVRPTRGAFPDRGRGGAAPPPGGGGGGGGPGPPGGLFPPARPPPPPPLSVWIRKKPAASLWSPLLLGVTADLPGQRYFELRPTLFLTSQNFCRLPQCPPHSAK